MEQKKMTLSSADTIAAIATPPGTGGIAVIRISGPDAIRLVSQIWKGKNLIECGSHTAHLGNIIQQDGSILDQVVATIYHAPNSYTGEDTVEISVHGSRWIQRQLMEELARIGVRPAQPGEFSSRAFLNGRMDLAQAEGVADLIGASSKAAHRLAMSQMSGSFSRRLNDMRDDLIKFASLLELELDFSEEDVEFADRSRLRDMAAGILAEIHRLADTYSIGKVFREGVPVAIAGVPNAGKSTLLNHLLEDDKAIVSDVPGTTRDVIEDTKEIDGILFRFIDTAGLRNTSDTVEQMGIRRAEERIHRASIILWILDATKPIIPQLNKYSELLDSLSADTQCVAVVNKTDLISQSVLDRICLSLECFKINNSPYDAHINITKNSHCYNKASYVPLSHAGIKNHDTDTAINQPDHLATTSIIPSANNIKYKPIPPEIFISAKSGKGTDKLLNILTELVRAQGNPESDMIVTNARHHKALFDGAAALNRAIEGIDSHLSADFIAQDVRETIHHLSLLTGTITTDALLSTIFSSFCIGK